MTTVILVSDLIFFSPHDVFCKKGRKKKNRDRKEVAGDFVCKLLVTFTVNITIGTLTFKYSIYMTLGGGRHTVYYNFFKYIWAHVYEEQIKLKAGSPQSRFAKKSVSPALLHAWVISKLQNTICMCLYLDQESTFLYQESLFLYQQSYASDIENLKLIGHCIIAKCQSSVQPIVELHTVFKSDNLYRKVSEKLELNWKWKTLHC